MSTKPSTRTPQELKAQALEAAARASTGGGRTSADTVEVFRADAARFFAHVPPPPLYRRRDEPQRAQAALLLDEATALLTRGYRHWTATDVKDFVATLELYIETLYLVAEGRVEAAEKPWSEARTLAEKTTAPSRLWLRPNLKAPKVFDRETRSSRFDPRSTESAQLKLPCPNCRKLSTFFVPYQQSRHLLSCQACAAMFSVFVAEVRSIEVGAVQKKSQYRFGLRDFGGLNSEQVVDDASATQLPVERGDLLAFLSMPATVLRAVLNLTSSRVLWLSHGGPCFLATAVFGPSAPQLDVFRAFRDRHLLPRRSGRLFIRLYYWAGPTLAAWVVKRPRLKQMLYFLLSGLHRSLLQQSDVWN